MQSKYSLDITDRRNRNGVLLSRIVRNDGTRGGYVQSEANLSQSGTCWLHNDSEAFGDARITENAQVYGQVFGHASVSGDCKINGQVFDSAVVGERAQVMGRVYGRANVRGSARVMGEALDDAIVDGAALILGRIMGAARAGGNDIVIGVRFVPNAPGAGAPGAAPPAPPTVVLAGYSAQAPVNGAVRIYLEPSFETFVDIHDPQQSILGWTELNKATGLAQLSIKAAAKVDIGRIKRSISAAALSAAGQSG
ncbi:hypothetical protein C2U70_09360 [Bradyrhizobium guangdongense]|uniref:hypothetical protein n=1 Tax=Bradyrhizobium guangdongense TaxID=1325090 RepID=UPI001129F29B|nr:hypothetical protein [Bradyrhizobium guangdongense]TPQ38223.1 hypothetical protein C2U70_09360 [Bradyrhizobium guangdongense]